MRQDGQKVFARTQLTGDPNDELLLYDFSKQVGDTVYLPLYGSHKADLAYVISAVNTVDLGGQTRVQQSITWLNSAVQKGTLIEGIGCVEGLHKIGGADCLTESYLFLDEPSAVAVDGPERKFCSFQSGSFTFEGLGVSLCKALPTQTHEDVPVSVYPSLSSGTLYFSVPDPSTTYQVTLFDLAGKQLLQTTLTGDGSITTAYKGTAIVFLQMTSGTAVKRVVLY
ncbi:MAG: T9SS type A sorting domain-containing protein [Saprospiraceae bacterium]